jgi:hypothetical protein
MLGNDEESWNVATAPSLFSLSKEKSDPLLYSGLFVCDMCENGTKIYHKFKSENTETKFKDTGNF